MKNVYKKNQFMANGRYWRLTVEYHRQGQQAVFQGYLTSGSWTDDALDNGTTYKVMNHKMDDAFHSVKYPIECKRVTNAVKYEAIQVLTEWANVTLIDDGIDDVEFNI